MPDIVPGQPLCPASHCARPAGRAATRRGWSSNGGSSLDGLDAERVPGGGMIV